MWQIAENEILAYYIHPSHHVVDVAIDIVIASSLQFYLKSVVPSSLRFSRIKFMRECDIGNAVRWQKHFSCEKMKSSNEQNRSEWRGQKISSVCVCVWAVSAEFPTITTTTAAAWNREKRTNLSMSMVSHFHFSVHFGILVLKTTLHLLADTSIATWFYYYKIRKRAAAVDWIQSKETEVETMTGNW